jgi:hypothetical protein
MDVWKLSAVLDLTKKTNESLEVDMKHLIRELIIYMPEQLV